MYFFRVSIGALIKLKIGDGLLMDSNLESLFAYAPLYNIVSLYFCKASNLWQWDDCFILLYIFSFSLCQIRK